MITLNYLHTMDFDFKDIKILNCKNTKHFERKIKNGEVILIDYDGITYGINASYIIYFE